MKPLQAFNLTVADYHTYFVAANDEADAVWVHNSCYHSVPEGYNPIAQKTEYGQDQWKNANGDVVYRGHDGKFYDLVHTPTPKPVDGNRDANSEVFHNQLPDELAGELETARKLGVKPMSLSDQGFEAVVNAGTIKWAVTESGELKIIPKYINEVELKHSVLTNGQPVLAAGEAEIAISGSKRVGITINRQTGHFQASEESLQIGVEEFKKHGIDFFDVVPNLFE
jgi:hypothetical protein